MIFSVWTWDNHGNFEEVIRKPLKSVLYDLFLKFSSDIGAWETDAMNRITVDILRLCHELLQFNLAVRLQLEKFHGEARSFPTSEPKTSIAQKAALLHDDSIVQKQKITN
ncbi:hypothetical protein QQP08_025370 [Theobroma cacao]|nr:hypothetical protein QQP08_025370 [Theobroma cacao]